MYAEFLREVAGRYFTQNEGVESTELHVSYVVKQTTASRVDLPFGIAVVRYGWTVNDK
jgi:hypothetical protein